MWGKDKTVGAIAAPDSRESVASDVSAILLSEVLFHREALARALRAYDGIAVIDSVADVHAALMLAEERSPDVLLVDSPSDAVAQTLAAHPLACKVIFIGAVGDGCRQLASGGAGILVGASSSLDEVCAALRFAKPRKVAPHLPASPPSRLVGGADSILTSREREVSRLVAGGHSNKEIADACGISIATVKNHVHRILGKLNFQRRTQITRLAGDSPQPISRKPATSADLAAVPDLRTGPRRGT